MAAKKKEPTYVVKSEFRDINDFSKVHEVGADVSDFEGDRLKDLVERGLVVEAGSEEAPDNAE